MSPLFAKKAEPFIDPTRGDAEAGRLRQAAAAQDWRPVEAALDGTADPLRREFLVDAVAIDSEDLRWVDAWVKERPASAAARLVWGACALQYAWKIRTGKAPQHVTSEQWKGFHEWLTHAQEQLQHAAAMAPEDSAPWVALLWCAVGLELPFEEARARWNELSRRNPATELGALGYTTYVGPRWNGTADAMWDFVRNLLNTEPEGSARWSLTPHAHMEQWVAERMRGNSQVHPSQYFLQPQVQRDVNDAYAKYLGSPHRRSSYLESQYRELFAGCFYLMGARDALRREMEQIGPGIQRLPWGYLGAAIATYGAVREAAGLK